MASARYANTKKSLLLVTLMILMTQVGYLENLNPWTSGEETLDQSSNMPDESAASLSSSGGSSSTYALTPSVEGAKLSVDVPMANITFQYNASAANGSGSGSNSVSYTHLTLPTKA